MGKGAARFFVLDEYHRHAGLSRPGRKIVDGGDDTRDLKTLVLACAQGLLYIDDQQCSGHGSVLEEVSGSGTNISPSPSKHKPQ
ncbi:hypothetical protein D3C71_2034610 [compost metagenome]